MKEENNIYFFAQRIVQLLNYIKNKSQKPKLTTMAKGLTPKLVEGMVDFFPLKFADVITQSVLSTGSDFTRTLDAALMNNNSKE